MNTKVVVAALLVAGCSRLGASNSRDTSVDAATPVIVVVDAAPEAALMTKPGIEASAATEIALVNGPALTVRAVGPSLIEVALRDKAAATWKAIEIERHVVAEESRQHDKLTRVGDPRRVHSARPATTYAYRARANGPWSAEVTVRTAEPGAAPPVPTSLAVKPLTPFAVQLAWEGDARMAAGFEIEVSAPGKDWVRAAVLDASARDFVHHHRLPKREYAYRVRAFNAVAASAPSAAASITTPERGVVETAALPPCRPLPSEGRAPKLGIPHELVNSKGTHPLHNVPEGSNGLRRHLFGEYQGCFRDFGVFELQDAAITDVDGFEDEGFPLLRGIAGAGEFAGAQIETIRFARGRYTTVDTALFCGSPYPDPNPDDPGVGSEGADLTSFAPPFAICQRDFER